MAKLFYTSYDVKQPLVSAKKFAAKEANASGESYVVSISTAGSEPSYWAMPEIEWNESGVPYGGGKSKYGTLVSTYNPALVNVALTQEEAQIVRDTLNEEELETDGFHGGIFKTPAEKSLWQKLTDGLAKVI